MLSRYYSIIAVFDWRFIRELAFQIRAIDQYTCTMADKRNSLLKYTIHSNELQKVIMNRKQSQKFYFYKHMTSQKESIMKHNWLVWTGNETTMNREGASPFDQIWYHPDEYNPAMTISSYVGMIWSLQGQFNSRNKHSLFNSFYVIFMWLLQRIII